jgi:hypothetical protein
MTDTATQDERIAAFLDGALDDIEQAAFEAELERDHELAAKVERMLQNDQLLCAAFDEPMQQGVDDALLERMGLAQKSTAEVIDLAGRRANSAEASRGANDNSAGWSRWRLPLGGAVAAAVVLVVAVSVRDTGSAFDAVLDNTPSGQMASLDDGVGLTPVLSFRAGDGRYCREFSLGSGEAGGSGIACRESDAWQVEALDRGATELAAASEIALADGADGSGLDATYARLGAGDPLGSEAESALIAGEWNSSEN